MDKISLPKNTNHGNISRRIFSDSLAALGAGLTVAPMITTVDVAVTCAQSGKQKMFAAFGEQMRNIFLRPHKFFLDKPFLWIFSVYTMTYFSNNNIDSFCKLYNVSDVIPKLIGVTSVNMSMSILKDAALARYFGTKKPSKVPAISYFLWLIRDTMSIAAAFIFPSRVAKILTNKRKMNPAKAEKRSQFACPILFQVVFLPLHLLGLDFYNNTKSLLSSRFQRIFKVYPGALPLRFFRMGSAFGIGGLNNKSLRARLSAKFDRKN